MGLSRDYEKGKSGTMGDLIDRQAAIDEIKALYEWHDTVTEDRAIDHLKRLPSAQPELMCVAKVTLTDEQVKEAVEKAKCEILTVLDAQPEIIRCKECRYYEWMSNRVPDEQTWFCHNWNAETGKDDYCSYAERREE